MVTQGSRTFLCFSLCLWLCPSLCKLTDYFRVSGARKRCNTGRDRSISEKRNITPRYASRRFVFLLYCIHARMDIERVACDRSSRRLVTTFGARPLCLSVRPSVRLSVSLSLSPALFINMHVYIDTHTRMCVYLKLISGLCQGLLGFLNYSSRCLPALVRRRSPSSSLPLMSCGSAWKTSRRSQ